MSMKKNSAINVIRDYKINFSDKDQIEKLLSKSNFIYPSDDKVCI